MDNLSRGRRERYISCSIRKILRKCVDIQMGTSASYIASRQHASNPTAPLVLPIVKPRAGLQSGDFVAVAPAVKNSREGVRHVSSTRTSSCRFRGCFGTVGRQAIPIIRVERWRRTSRSVRHVPVRRGPRPRPRGRAGRKPRNRNGTRHWPKTKRRRRLDPLDRSRWSARPARLSCRLGSIDLYRGAGALF